MKFQCFTISILAILLFTACHRKTVNQSSTQYNQVFYDAQGNPQLIGRCTEDGLKQAPFNSWYVTNYNDYTPDSVTLVELRPALRGKTFQLFMATWCGDSKREVPRIYKIFSACGVPPTAIELINVFNTESAYKQSPTHEERGLNIHRVPTLIIYRNGQEINRIVELPNQSLEKDLLQLLQQNDYVPKYKTAAWLQNWYLQTGWQEKQKDSLAMAAQFKTSLLHQSELDALGRIQLAAGETDKALFTLKLNTIIYPALPLTNRSYAKVLQRTGDTALARIFLEKSVALSGQ